MERHAQPRGARRVPRAAARRPRPARRRTCPTRSSRAPPLGSARRTISASVAGHAGGCDLLADLRQFLGAIEYEVAHAVPRPGLADRAARLDRVHEMDGGIREHLPHQGHFADRGAVEMADAAVVQRAQHRRFRVALHRVHHRAGERRDERARGGGDWPGAGSASAPPGAASRPDDRPWAVPREAPHARRQSGGAAARRRCEHAGCSSEGPRNEHAATRQRRGRRVRTESGENNRRHALNAPRRRGTQPMLRGLRIAAN